MPSRQMSLWPSLHWFSVSHSLSLLCSTKSWRQPSPISRETGTVNKCFGYAKLLNKACCTKLNTSHYFCWICIYIYICGISKQKRMWPWNIQREGRSQQYLKGSDSQCHCHNDNSVFINQLLKLWEAASDCLWGHTNVIQLFRQVRPLGVQL